MFLKKYLKWISTILVLIGILLTNFGLQIPLFVIGISKIVF